MEKGKENVNRIKNLFQDIPKTKIPLPLNPLPPIPKHLLAIKEKMETVKRKPLVSLNNQIANVALAGPSQKTLGKIVPHKPKQPLLVDTKHVTLRKRFEDLDWNFSVFNDKKEEGSVSSDDESIEEKNINQYFPDNKKCVVNSNVAITPSLNFLEPIRIKNIKRSLKRPHSRELIGLSPKSKREKDMRDGYKRKSNDKIFDRLAGPDILQTTYKACLSNEYSSDIFTYLTLVERKPMAYPNVPSATRACCLNWLMKVNGPNGNPAMVQTAAWYLDSILGLESVAVDQLQLIAAACYWIAQKHHGPPTCSRRLVKCANNAFCSGRLLAAEKAVMHTLKFPVQPVVPQDYITYLSWWCDPEHPGDIEIASTFLTMSGMMVNKVLCDEYPSVIAVAAVRTALLLMKKREMVLRLQTCPVYKEVEKKSVNMSAIRSALRKAVRTVASTKYEYNAPFEHYGVPPHYVAHNIVNAAGAMQTEFM